MANPPFLATEELCDSLQFDARTLSIARVKTPTQNQQASQNQPPSQTQTPIQNQTPSETLPGQARIGLHDPAITEYMTLEFLTLNLNRFSPYLWLVAKQDSKHISSLTHQAVRGRSVVITENPEIHLTWIDNRLYIKPIPKYLLSHSFWMYYLAHQTSPIPEVSRNDITASIKGFLRSYAHLIKHKSDFRIAESSDDLAHQLIPKGIGYSKFTRFISKFEDISDNEVSERYKFGELRLSRLNLWSPLILHRLAFQKVYTQYGAYFARFFGPLLFVWASLSLALGAFQVLLATQPYFTTSLVGSWESLDNTAKGFSVATLVFLLLSTAILLLLLFILILREAFFALWDLWRKRAAQRAGRHT